MPNPNLTLQQDPFSGFIPNTLASAASVAPTSAFTLVTGTVQVATIVPPVRAAHLLVLVFTDNAPGALLTTGNIGVAVTPVKNTALILAYVPNLNKYYPCAVSGTTPVSGATAGPFTSITSITVANGLVTALTGT